MNFATAPFSLGAPRFFGDGFKPFQVDDANVSLVNFNQVQFIKVGERPADGLELEAQETAEFASSHS